MFAHDRMIARAIPGSSRTPIVVGLVNNMPDLALRTTERQFCALLSAASRDFVVRLKLFSLPETQRSETARAHIARYYEDPSELFDDPPDGLIVTGTEPRATRLQDEPCWHSLADLASWTQDRAIPSVWSCLAAHAAVLHLDGIERQPLGRKLSGVFDCQINSASQEIVHGTPAQWRVPHSRMNGLPEDALLAHGYKILSSSSETGPDMFTRGTDNMSLFFQGHPEYSTSTLLGEYRRDVGRFLSGERGSYPEMPSPYFSAIVETALVKFRERAERQPDVKLLEELATIVEGSAVTGTWFSTATQIYTNWLSILSERRAYRRKPSKYRVFETL